jgi:hypothetical protein
MSALHHHFWVWVWALAVMAALVAVFGWLSGWTAVFATAGFAWLMLNGFVEDRYGVLRWHGRGDIVGLAVLITCGAAVAGLREAQIRLRRRAVVRSVETELRAMAGPPQDIRSRHG